MRISHFDPFGPIFTHPTEQKNPEQKLSLHQKISEEIARNEAMRLALLAMSDQEKDRRRRRRKFRILNRKQANVLFSQLRHVGLDVKRFLNGEDKELEEKEFAFRLSKGKKTVKIQASAVMAIAAAGEAWVAARNRDLSEVVSNLFYTKGPED